MHDILLILSALGVLNSFILIIYSLSTKRGKKITNILFAGLVFALTIRVWKSILLTFSENLHDFILNLGLSGFIAVGPLFMLFVKSATTKNYRFTKKDFYHILPSLIFVFLWWLVVNFRDNNFLVWDLIYRTILLQYVVYIFITIKLINTFSGEYEFLKKQFYFIAIFLLIIWFTYFLNAVSGFPYLGGAIVYSGFVYFSLILFMNKGYIINFNPSKKYEKTGLTKAENDRFVVEIKQSMEVDKIFKDNTLSLTKLADKLNISTHIISQVINENLQKSFYELLSYHRINEAKNLLNNKSMDLNISEIAFEVGYNSLSAFNSAFKKETGLTPSQFRNGINNGG